MRRTNQLLAAAALFCIGPGTAVAKDLCSLPDPIMLMSEGEPHVRGSKLLQYWDIPNLGLWDQDSPAPSGYDGFREALKTMRVERSARALLRASPSINNDIVLRNWRSWSRKLTCLEMALLARQEARISVRQAPTEFVSAVLVSPDGGTQRVYYYTVNMNGIGNMSPVTDLIKTDVRSGWILRYVLHNHAYYPASPPQNGIAAPSVPDADFNLNLSKELQLPEARITNGLRTVRIPSTAFHEFQTQYTPLDKARLSPSLPREGLTSATGR